MRKDTKAVPHRTLVKPNYNKRTKLYTIKYIDETGHLIYKISRKDKTEIDQDYKRLLKLP